MRPALEIAYQHQWPTTSIEANRMLDDIVGEIEIQSNTIEPKRIASVDSAYGFNGDWLYAAAVVLSYPGFKEIERQYARHRPKFPYHPGLLFYREGPAVIEALEKLESDADLIILPSHGLAHPKNCGLASHVGLAFDRPSIGCARKILIGRHAPVGFSAGSFQIIRMRGKDVGVAYRSKDNVKPIFISPGHKCDLQFSHLVISNCLRGFRFPEPLRIAHLLANKYKSQIEKQAAKNGQAGTI